MMPSTSSGDNNRSNKRSRLTIVGLFAIFLAPIAVAWLFTSGYLDTKGLGRTNRGFLVTPPLDFRSVEAAQPLFEQANLEPGEWLVLYLSPSTCGDSCISALERLLTIRSVLGYAGQRVHIYALTSADIPSATVSEAHAGRIIADIKMSNAIGIPLSQQTHAPMPQIVFLDWRKQLVMRFNEDTESIDIKKDLSRLLRASKIR